MINLTKRQKEILETSIDLIAEAGIQNLTIRNISEKIGITEPAIYRHYKSKQDILLGILSYFEDSSLTMLNEIQALHSSNINKLEKIFIKKCEEFAKKPEFAKVIFSEEIFQNDEKLSKKVEKIMQLHQTVIMQIISDAINNKEIRTDIPMEHLSIIMMGSLRLIVTKWRLSKFQFDIENQAKEQWKSIAKLIKVNEV